MLQHGFERLPDHRGAHFARAQIAHFLDLQEFKERIALGSSHQSGFFPGCQLTGRDPQDAEQIGLSVSIHDWYWVLTVLSEKLLPVGKAKLTGKGISADNLPKLECKIRGKLHEIKKLEPASGLESLPADYELSFGFQFAHAKHVELKQLNKFQPARKEVQAMLITLDLNEGS
jgi:hypothetical protein